MPRDHFLKNIGETERIEMAIRPDHEIQADYHLGNSSQKMGSSVARYEFLPIFPA